jgi:hypothetical protein
VRHMPVENSISSSSIAVLGTEPTSPLIPLPAPPILDRGWVAPACQVCMLRCMRQAEAFHANDPKGLNPKGRFPARLAYSTRMGEMPLWRPRPRQAFAFAARVARMGAQDVRDPRRSQEMYGQFFLWMRAGKARCVGHLRRFAFSSIQKSSNQASV